MKMKIAEEMKTEDEGGKGNAAGPDQNAGVHACATGRHGNVTGTKCYRLASPVFRCTLWDKMAHLLV